MLRPMATVTIYTDGSCSGNPGPGGYGVVLLAGDRRKELSGGFRRTTNNRMEILAAIVGVEALKTPCHVALHSDSQYLVNAMTKGWARSWRAKGWKKQDGEPAKNPDLWARLLEACAKHHVVFHWVRGHAGNTENERCDALAVQAMQGATAVDVGYEGADAPPEAPARPTPKPKTATLALGDGPPCKACGTPLERRVPKGKAPKPGSFYYEWFHACPSCGRTYMPPEAKRSWEQHPEWREL